MTEEKKEIQEDAELDSSFNDAGGNRWKVKLPLVLVDEFCDEHNITLGNFAPDKLKHSHLLTLAYRGSRWMTLAKEHPMTRAEFLNRLCDDDGNPTPAYTGAIVAAMNAVVNFTLRATVPPEKMRDAVNIVQTVRDAEMSKANRGAGETA